MSQQTAKEKAAELINRYIIYVTEMREYEYAKQCALITAREVLNEYMFDDSAYSNRRYKYWQEVKQEIEKL